MSNIVKTNPAIQALPKYQDKISALLGSAYEPGEYMAMLDTMLKITLKQDIEPASVFATVLQMAALKLSPLPQLQEVWAIPYKGQLTMQLGWRGLVKIARRNPDIRNIEAHVVRADDRFNFQLGTLPRIHHVPDIQHTTGAITHAYAVAFGPDGHAFSFQVLPVTKVNHIRDTAGNARSTPWTQHYDEMAKKTAVRALCKMLPSPELSSAVAVDDLHSQGKVREAAQVLNLDTQDDGRDWRGELNALCEGDTALTNMIPATGMSQREVLALFQQHDGDPETFVEAIQERIDEAD